MEAPARPHPPTAVPPTVAEPPQNKPSSWPTVVGTFAIILAGAGILAHSGSGLVGCEVVGEFSGHRVANAARAAVVDRFAPWNFLSHLGSFALATLLLAAGIGMVRQRPWCVKVSLWWSALKMLYAIPVAILVYAFSTAKIEAMEQAMAGDSMAVLLTAARGFTVAITVTGLVWAWLFPLFLLTWCCSHHIRAEVATWPQDKPSGLSAP